MDELRFTNDELVRALQQATAHNEDEEAAVGMTTPELAEVLGMSERKVLKRIRQLIEAGVVEHVQIPRKRITGVVGLRDGWRFKNSENGTEKAAE